MHGPTFATLAPQHSTGYNRQSTPTATVAALIPDPVASILDDMFSVSREIDFCYGHRLLNYEGKCRHLHGHNGKVVITFEALSLDSRGMVLDFSDIKQTVNRWIDDNLDHRMILERDDPAVAVLRELKEPVYLMDVNPTVENIAKLIFDVARSQGLPVVNVKMWETPRCSAEYRGPTDPSSGMQ